jgi:hypothetical protein
MVASIGLCCLGLIAALGQKKVALPDNPAYIESLSSYFAQQVSQTQPACIVTATQPNDVATALRTITNVSQPLQGAALDKCKFAVRSGGHSSIPTAANIQGGVVIDLSGLDSVSLNAGSAVVSMGPGATWDAAYAVLDPAGLAVAGGRTAGVGVGGLTTGGGISFFSPRVGWTADSVVTFQVALANGTLIEAKASGSHGDLLWALRGGSNNFGVVTRVDLQAFDQGQLWGGFSFHDASTIDAVAAAVEEFADAATYDPNSSLICSFVLLPGQPPAIANNVVYTQPVEDPPAFRGITSIPSLMSSFRLTSPTSLAEELAAQQAYGIRQLSATLTHRATASYIQAAWQRWSESHVNVAGVANLSWTLSLEPVPPTFYQHNAQGNALGLGSRTGSLVVAVLNAAWSDAADDAKIRDAARSLINALTSEAKTLGAYDPFVYLNYAGSWQNPLASYGADSVARLRSVQRRYDPKSVFTTLVPGGFKIPA